MGFKDYTCITETRKHRKINHHLELKNPMQNDRKDSTTIVKTGYYKNLQQIFCCKDAKMKRP